MTTLERLVRGKTKYLAVGAGNWIEKEEVEKEREEEKEEEENCKVDDVEGRYCRKLKVGGLRKKKKGNWRSEME